MRKGLWGDSQLVSTCLKSLTLSVIIGSVEDRTTEFQSKSDNLNYSQRDHKGTFHKEDTTSSLWLYKHMRQEV